MTWQGGGARRRGRPAEIAGLLFDLARRAGPDRWRQALAHAAAARALGPQLARRLEAVESDGQRLVLVVRGAATAREVERHAPELARRLRAALRDGAVTIGVRAVPEERRAREPEPAEAPTEDRPLTREALEEVADPALRARLARWAHLKP